MVWRIASPDKDDERWLILKRYHPTLLPFDVVTPWICEHLVEEYEA